MQKQIDDIKDNVKAMTTKLDKVIAIDAKRELEIENRLTKVEVRNALLSKLTFLGIVTVIGSFFAMIKNKLGI